MATVRQYGYYIKGNKVAIVERDTQFDNDVNSKDYGPGSDRAQWKSPLATVADGIELQYVHSPEYFIRNTQNALSSLTHYSIESNTGQLKLWDTTSSFVNYDLYLDAGDYFVLKKAGKFNGLHQVAKTDSFESDGGGTNNIIITDTLYSGMATTVTAFEETPELYYNIDILDDENDTIDLSNYLSKALVYYVKAKIAEDVFNLEMKEYFMKEFRKMVEKYNNTRVAGARMISSGPYAVR